MARDLRNCAGQERFRRRLRSERRRAVHGSCTCRSVSHRTKQHRGRSTPKKMIEPSTWPACDRLGDPVRSCGARRPRRRRRSFGYTIHGCRPTSAATQPALVRDQREHHRDRRRTTQQPPLNRTARRGSAGPSRRQAARRSANVPMPTISVVRLKRDPHRRLAVHGAEPCRGPSTSAVEVPDGPGRLSIRLAPLSSVIARVRPSVVGPAEHDRAARLARSRTGPPSRRASRVGDARPLQPVEVARHGNWASDAAVSKQQARP